MIEHHRVTLIKEMEIDDNEIIDAGVTSEQFEEYLIDQDSVDAEIADKCWDLVYSCSECMDTDEDWVSDRKGFTEVEYKLGSFDDPCKE
jgi:hypothetical protein